MRSDHTQKLLGRVLVAAALLLLAFNLRPLFSSTAMLLPDIIRGLNLSAATAGYLTTLPVLCMGVFAPLAPRIAQRIGVERTLLLVLALITLGVGLRGFVSTSVLFLGTGLAGAGIAVGNVLLPSLIKRDFADKAALMTGLYTTSLVGGASLAAASTLPLAQWFGEHWSWGLAFWAVPALLATLVWSPVAIQAGGRSSNGRHILPVRGLYRDPLAWAVTLFMGLQSALAYCVLGWMAPILRAGGLSGTEAGLVTSVSLLLQVVSCLVTPWLAMRFHSQRGVAVWLTSLATLGLMGMVLGPRWAIWPLAVLQGLGQGGLFALALMFIVLRSRDANVAAHLSSMSQATGYILAASGPLLVGALFAWTGSFQVTSALFAFLGLTSGLAGWYAGRPAYVKAVAVASSADDA